jgi:hypothetical protein
MQPRFVALNNGRAHLDNGSIIRFGNGRDDCSPSERGDDCLHNRPGRNDRDQRHDGKRDDHGWHDDRERLRERHTGHEFD